MEKNNSTPEKTRDAVRNAYARIASGGGSCCGPSPCCGSGTSDSLSKKLGYSDEELAVLPTGADMGLSCGNPLAIEALSLGETVLDLGSGGGFDVFIAAKKVGQDGAVIGVDMTPDMISRARINADRFREDTGLSNVEFRLGEIEHLPVADASVDVVISNCVINLSIDKPQVWREIARVLKPGGRVAVSDLALLKPLPEALRESIEAYVGCIAGAVLLDEMERMIGDAGLVNCTLVSHPNHIDVMINSNDQLYSTIMEILPEGYSAGDFVTSVTVAAEKPQ